MPYKSTQTVVLPLGCCGGPLSYLVKNPEDRFSCDVAPFNILLSNKFISINYISNARKVVVI